MLASQRFQQRQRRPHIGLQIAFFAVLGGRHNNNQQIHRVRRQHGCTLGEILAVQLHSGWRLRAATDGTDAVAVSD